MSPLGVILTKLNYSQHPFHYHQAQAPRRNLRSHLKRKEAGNSRHLGSKEDDLEELLWDTASRCPAWQGEKSRGKNRC